MAAVDLTQFLTRTHSWLQQYASAEADKAKCRGGGGEDKLGAAYTVPVRSRSTPAPAPPCRLRAQRALTPSAAPLRLMRPMQNTLEKQVLSTITSPPKIGFGASKRSSPGRASPSPGPGAYRLRPTLGSGVGAPSAKFGTAGRDAASKVFISTEHDKAVGGQDSPGPGAYRSAVDGLGRQHVSGARTRINISKQRHPRHSRPH